MHLEIVQGTPFEVLVSVKRRDESNNALVAYELTNCTVRMVARFRPSELPVLLDISSNSGEITIDEELGTFLIALTSDETSALVWGQPYTQAKALFQCEVTASDGETFRALEGTISLNPELVR